MKLYEEWRHGPIAVGYGSSARKRERRLLWRLRLASLLTWARGMWRR